MIRRLHKTNRFTFRRISVVRRLRQIRCPIVFGELRRRTSFLANKQFISPFPLKCARGQWYVCAQWVMGSKSCRESLGQGVRGRFGEGGFSCWSIFRFRLGSFNRTRVDGGCARFVRSFFHQRITSAA